MWVIFTPFSYLFMLIYFVILMYMSSISSYLFFWLYIEMLILVFIGFSFTIFTNSFTQLILYFLVQTLASFNILVFLLLNLPLLSVLAIMLKLGLFPFFSWYLNVLIRFPNIILLVVSTLNKLPVLYFVIMISSYLVDYLIVLSALLTSLFIGCYMLTIVDLRYLIVASSVVNSSFFLFGVLSCSQLSFVLYFISYTVSLYLFISLLGNQTKLNYFNLFSSDTNKFYTLFLLFNMGGFPPLPSFILNFFLVYSFVSNHMFLMNYVMVFILFNCAVMVSYFLCFTKLLVNVYSTPSYSVFN